MKKSVCSQMDTEVKKVDFPCRTCNCSVCWPSYGESDTDRQGHWLCRKAVVVLMGQEPFVFFWPRNIIKRRIWFSSMLVFLALNLLFHCKGRNQLLSWIRSGIQLGFGPRYSRLLKSNKYLVPSMEEKTWWAFWIIGKVSAAADTVEWWALGE